MLFLMKWQNGEIILHEEKNNSWINISTEIQEEDQQVAENSYVTSNNQE